jgi:hypothetical protein
MSIARSTIPAYIINGKIHFTIPEIESSDSSNGKKVTILVLDASGSMDSYFSFIAQNWNNFKKKIPGEIIIQILFSDDVREFDGDIPLRNPISRGTEIIPALNFLKNILNKFSAQDYIRILFVSDGADNTSHTFEARLKDLLKTFKSFIHLDFFVFGITTNFPAFFSQMIRGTLHTGDPNLPSLFMSENNHQVTINTEFENLSKFIKVKKSLETNILLKRNPCAENSNKFFSGTHVFCELQTISDQLGEIIIDGIPYNLVKNTLSYQTMITIFNQWLTDIQSKACLDLSIIEDAKIMKQMVEQIYNYFHSSSECLSDSANSLRTFSQRVAKKRLRRDSFEYEHILKMFNDYASGLILKKLSNKELAEKVRGHTETKYSSVATKLYSYTESGFAKDKESLGEIILSHNKSLKKLCIEEAEQCLITLDNLYKIVDDDEFMNTLRSSTIDEYLTNFGLTGQGINIEISDASSINPWVSKIRSIARSCGQLSQLALEELLTVNDSTLSSEEKEQKVVKIKLNDRWIISVNAICPLFYSENQEDTDFIKQLLLSNIIQMAITYSITKQVGTLNPNAHLGALSSMLVHLIKEDDSEMKKELIEKIRFTTSLYNDRKNVRDFIEMLWNNPNRVVVTEIKDESIKCQSITKLILFVDCSYLDKSPEHISNVFFHIFKEFFGRTLDGKSFNDFFDIKTIKEPKFPTFEEIYELLENSIPGGGYHVNEAIKFVEDKVNKFVFDDSEKLFDSNDIIIKMDNVNKLYNSGNVGSITFETLIKYAELIIPGFTECEFFKQNIIRWIIHGINNKSPNERMKEVLNYDDSISEIMKFYCRFNNTDFKSKKRTLYKSLVTDKWNLKFRENHTELAESLPLSEILSKLNIKEGSVEYDNCVKMYNSSTGLCGDRCHIKSCPYYLQRRTDFVEHLKALQEHPLFIPGLHNTLTYKKSSSISEITNCLTNGLFRASAGLGESVSITKIDSWKNNGKLEELIKKFNKL